MHYVIVVASDTGIAAMAWDIADYPMTEAQWCHMVDNHIGRPEPLSVDTLPETWVYYRPWGMMFVPFGCHQGAMATLYAFHHGYRSYITAGNEMDIKSYRVCETLADRFLMELDGTAFLSSAGKAITCGRREHLDARERQAFRNFTINYLD
jgi:hypothetical protein